MASNPSNASISGARLTALSLKESLLARFRRKDDNDTVDRRSDALRLKINPNCQSKKTETEDDLNELYREFEFLRDNASRLRPIFDSLRARRVLYCGQAYYNSWYLSRSLRKFGWKTELLNWDTNDSNAIFYHGHDVRFTSGDPYEFVRDFEYFLQSVYSFDVFHFANAGGMSYGGALSYLMTHRYGANADIFLLKALGKSIVYSNNGCQDGATRSGFASWGKVPVCDECAWRERPDVCSDEKNSEWGQFRNSAADFQILFGGNRVDYNCHPSIHEVPEFYCLSPEIWSPNINIPNEYLLDQNNSIRLYHAVGNFEERTGRDGVNIKSTHIYMPLVQKLKSEGMQIELLSPKGVPNIDVRFIQLQADIFLEMLTFGWFGANAREAMMLGKPVICYLRPEWLESVASELPDYVEELPVVSATPATVELVLRDLISSKEKRLEIGRRSRSFALKWHSDAAAARRCSEIYDKLLRSSR